MVKAIAPNKKNGKFDFENGEEYNFDENSLRDAYVYYMRT